MKRTFAALLLLLLCPGLAGCGRARIVGKDIPFEAVTEFYYTYASSTFPPEYQRYRFYVEDGRYMFCHERREGDGFPLGEEDITVSGTIELSPSQWSEFLDRVTGGQVVAREESLDSGDPGPWFYLYWRGDKGKYQQFSFESLAAQRAFESFCETLANS